MLVVGGGTVGARRALWFHDAGASVRVIAREFRRELVEKARSSSRLVLVEAELPRDTGILEEHVKWADIVVIATDDPSVNELVWETALRHHKLVNDATNAERTHVVVPYTARVWGLSIAVTSEGRSGVAARHARDRIVECLERDRELKTLYEAMVRVKKMLKETISDAKKRIPLYFRIDEDPLFREAVRRGDVEAAVRRAREIVEEALSSEPPGDSL